MAGSTDWEDLMNGVFGPGGRFRGAAGGKGPEKDLADAQKKLEEAAARTAAAKTPTAPAFCATARN